MRGEVEKSSGTGEQRAETLCDLDQGIERKLDEVNDLIGKLCDAIRARVWSTAATGWDRSEDTAG